MSEQQPTPPKTPSERLALAKTPMADHPFWPLKKRRPFTIYEESQDEQLAKELAASPPLSYEHDNKENMKPQEEGPRDPGNEGDWAGNEPSNGDTGQGYVGGREPLAEREILL